MGVVGKFNPWVFSPGTEYERMDQRTMAYLTTKYYPWYIFDGWHIDAMAGWSQYKTIGITGPKLDEGTYAANMTLGQNRSRSIAQYFNDYMRNVVDSINAEVTYRIDENGEMIQDRRRRTLKYHRLSENTTSTS